MKKRITLIILALIVVYGIAGAITAVFAQKAIKTTKQAIGAAKLQDLDATKAYLKDAGNQFKKVKLTLTAKAEISLSRDLDIDKWNTFVIQRCKVLLD